MRFKIDENLPHECTELLTDAGHQTETVHTEGLLWVVEAGRVRIRDGG